ncbi:MAG: AAA family ATPase [Candidatus Diapherotrites archaeon]|nr:AAA family ATPase [Candidatus Diapherotrites archaeon]
MANIFSEGKKEREIFKNEEVLYPEYVPEILPHRESQINEIVFALKPLAKAKKASNLFLFGPPGTGKTASINYVIRELEEYTERAKALYINCFDISSRHAVLSELARFFSIALPRRGIAGDEILARILERARTIDFRPLIVLDEIDRLGSEEASKLLYDLLRMDVKQKPSVVLISNYREFVAFLDARVRSSLAAILVEFPRYSPTELKDILRERAKYAFYENCIEQDAINLAAAFAAKHGGDARIAIELLLHAGRIAEAKNKEKLTAEDVKEATKKIVVVPLDRIVANLNEAEKIILKIIAKKQPIISGELFESFLEEAKDKEIAKSERSYRNMIARLSALKLINAEETNLKTRGKTRRISLAVNKEELLSRLDNK